MSICYLDIETTGLSVDDEVLQVAIINDSGDVLLDTLVKPIHKNEWPEAEQIHGISLKDVSNAPMFKDISPQIAECLFNKEVVIYNAEFEMQFLEKELKHASEVHCCMMEFAIHYAEWHDYHQDFVWQTLDTAADHVLHDWQADKQHSALGDCKATRSVWQYLTRHEIRKTIDLLKKEQQRQQEIAWEVDHYLNNLIYEEHHFIRELHAMSDVIWMELIFKRRYSSTWPFNKESLFDHRKKSELYYNIFTGLSKKIYLAVLSCSDKTRFKHKKDIPNNLKKINQIDEPKWVLDEMTAAAYFLSESGKTFFRLYNISEIKKIKSRHLPRYESWGAVPSYLKSRTRIKKEHKFDVLKHGLSPSAEARMVTPYEVKYIPLYDTREIHQ